MPNTTISSREFNHDVGAAKKAAANGPVFITDRGRPSHVLLTVEAYRRLLTKQPSIVDLLAMPEAAEIEFEPAPATGPLSRPADLS
jgi:PHD/YefM family antitoxin component YafN of YafNO toxin-antitoxin module